MKKAIPYAVLSIACLLALAGCGGYNQLLKSNDSELMYVKGLEYYKKGKYQRAIQLFEQIKPVFIGTAREDSLSYYLGAAYYKKGEFDSSEITFDDFRRRFGRSAFLEDVEYMYAMGFYFSSPPPYRDQAVTVQGITAITEYLERYPNSTKRETAEKRLQELREKLYDKEYLNARTYYKIGRYKSAITALKNALAKYPDSPHREEMLYLVAVSTYELADNSIQSLQRDRYLDMMDAYYSFIAEYPESRYRRELDKLMNNAKEYIASTETTTEDSQTNGSKEE